MSVENFAADWLKTDKNICYLLKQNIDWVWTNGWYSDSIFSLFKIEINDIKKRHIEEVDKYHTDKNFADLLETLGYTDELETDSHAAEGFKEYVKGVCFSLIIIDKFIGKFKDKEIGNFKRFCRDNEFDPETLTLTFTDSILKAGYALSFKIDISKAKRVYYYKNIHIRVLTKRGGCVADAPITEIKKCIESIED